MVRFIPPCMTRRCREMINFLGSGETSASRRESMVTTYLSNGLTGKKRRPRSFDAKRSILIGHNPRKHTPCALNVSKELPEFRENGQADYCPAPTDSSRRQID